MLSVLESLTVQTPNYRSARTRHVTTTAKQQYLDEFMSVQILGAESTS